MTDLKALRAIAEAATQPSPWTVREDVTHTRWGASYNHVVMDRDYLWVAECGEDEHNSAYIAAFNPAQAIALLDRVELLERLLTRSLSTLVDAGSAHFEDGNRHTAQAILDEVNAIRKEAGIDE